MGAARFASPRTKNIRRVVILNRKNFLIFFFGPAHMCVHHACQWENWAKDGGEEGKRKRNIKGKRKPKDIGKKTESNKTKRHQSEKYRKIKEKQARKEKDREEKQEEKRKGRQQMERKREKIAQGAEKER